MSYKRPEILAPAGNREMMRAAVENGADAIYFGLQDFNARLRAGNFEMGDLPEIMAWLHERGVRGYVTMNTLVFASEMESAAALLMKCNAAGVDAVLIQDLGLAALAARLVPELPIHASTQMTITSAESIGAARELGLNLQRIVAARETSIRELQKMMRDTDAEIEVFVHGALCVAYSGQCLTSEALGGRSANRGECAQACRLPYDLIVDGEVQDTGDVKYLLSPKDLAAYEDLDKLTALGIASLKIEGRLKSPQYVAATVQSYRRALEQVFEAGDEQVQAPAMEAETRRKLEMTFSRGFTGGYLHDIDHQVVVEGRFPKKRGSYLGRVSLVGSDSVTVQLEGAVRNGDGIVFDAGRPEQDEQGGRIYGIKIGGKAVSENAGGSPVAASLTFGRGAIDFRHVHAGDRVWKTSDPQLDRELESSYEGEQPKFRRPVSAKVRGQIGRLLELTLCDKEGFEVTVPDSAPAEVANRRPLTREVVEDQIGRMGGTPFYLAELELELKGDLLVPFSRLNDLRRRAVDELTALRREKNRNRRLNAGALAQTRLRITEVPEAPSDELQISVMCRTLEQVSAAAADPNVNMIYTDFEDVRLHREARELIGADKVFAPATLRILKPGESGIVRKLLECRPDAVLVRNLGAWQILHHAAPSLPIYADYSLNTANDLTAALLIEHGFSRLTPSYDLNIDQLLDLLGHAPASWFEVTIHQRIPMFHMEHCVFCRFLSSGTDHTNCGRPCEEHTLELRDRVGYKHPVKADAGCRNTVFNAVAQSASEYLDAIRGAGVRAFRIEFISESADDVRETVAMYAAALRGETAGRALWKKLHAVSKLGVTRGSLDHE